MSIRLDGIKEELNEWPILFSITAGYFLDNYWKQLAL